MTTTMHPYMAYELARSRQEEVRRQTIRHQRRLSYRRQEPSRRRLRFWGLRTPLPRPAPAR